MNDIKSQGFHKEKNSYKFLNFSRRPQQLQELYPGRLMSNQWHYTGENIPNEDPEGLRQTEEEESALSRAASMEEEALARHLGGKNKIVRHPFVAPESTVENPELRSISIDPNLQKVPSTLEGFTPFSPADKTHGAHPPDFVTPRNSPPYWRESYTLLADDSKWRKDIEKEIKTLEDELKKDRLWLWLSLGGGALLFIVIIGIVIYTSTRHK